MTETMSKRDHFSVLILAGLLANSGLDPTTPDTHWAEIAVNQADELIRYLDALDVAENYNAHVPEAEEDA